MELNENILHHYNEGQESTRLAGLSLERLRTESILARLLPPAPAKVLDVGGADGVYAFPLASRGYEVTLVDPVPLHLEQAKRKHGRLKAVELGDARLLRQEDESQDVVLYLGPLYHLTEEKERRRALDEAYRVLKPGGLFVGAQISRFAAFLDGVRTGILARDEFHEIVVHDLADGKHRNPTRNPGYFTDAYFQRPDEAKAELSAAGFHGLRQVAVEGPVWTAGGLDQQLADPVARERILALLERLEEEPSLLGASGHYLTLGTK